MKCATETMGTIIRRFGYKRALNFVLPVKNNIYLGWPYIMMKTDYRPSKWPYNIIFEHSVYNYTIMTSLMPNNTVYLTTQISDHCKWDCSSESSTLLKDL
jgi:hypothetical protein